MKKTDFDIGAARRLVDAISADLAALPAGSERHAQLRREVEELEGHACGYVRCASPAVEAGMRSVHSLVDRASAELQRDGVKAGMFLQDLGRMLGLD